MIAEILLMTKKKKVTFKYQSKKVEGTFSHHRSKQKNWQQGLDLLCF